MDQPINPSAILNRAENAAREGRYEEALQDFVWFHEHALEHEPSQYGVRLSFALASWLSLARDYPPALDELRAIRDRKLQMVLADEADRSLFHDVETINENLGDVRLTYSAFVHMHEQSPALAKDCADLALKALIAHGDYALARTYVSDPRIRIQACAARLNSQVAHAKKEFGDNPTLRDAFVKIYVDDVNEVLAILEGTSESELAEAIRRFAVNEVSSAEVRESVVQTLEAKPRPNST